MRKLLACLFLLILMTSILSGCWSRKEMGELAIVLGVGVDRAPDGQVELTLQLAKPSAFAGGGEGAGGKEPPTWVISETGKTVLDAQRKLATRISRHIYWAHCIILVLGEEAARDDITHYLNFFSRAPQPRENMWAMVAKGKAKDILETYSELEKTSAQDIGYLARAKTGYSVTIKDFRVMYYTKGANTIASKVEIVERGVTPGGPQKENPTKLKGVALTGTAVFRGKTMVGWLDESETRGLLWLRGEVLKGVISVPSLTIPGRETSINIIRGHTEVKPQYDGESVWFDVKIDVEGDLLEMQVEDIMEREVREDVEKEIAREVEERARFTLKKAQGEYGADIFGFGVAFHRRYPKEWKELKDKWDEVFADAGVNITVEAHLRRSGLMSKRPTG
ncbi:MAG: Spore germination protein A3 precursor [Pelotomaculum sp. PtaB.Bin104]|nr:MAG: Spore germination protein A3 precursor [Pelotomaculum sp. PtaB.Bin104]